MTSNASQDRLEYVFGDYGYMHPLRLNNVFDFRIVYSKEATVQAFPNITHVQTPCKDIAGTNDGLICRVDFAQTHFPPDVAWYYRAMDDTYLHLDNLMKLISILEQIYDPFTDIVFRAFPNWCWTPYPYVGGGSGWLMSNAFVTHLGKEIPSLLDLSAEALNGQDDTTLYTIVSRIFDSSEQWGDVHFIDQIVVNSYSDNLQCASKIKPPYKKLNEAVALHVAPVSFLNNASRVFPYGREASEKMTGDHPELRYLLTHTLARTTMCVADPSTPSIPITLEYENRSYKLARPRDFADYPLSWWKPRPYRTETYLQSRI